MLWVERLKRKFQNSRKRKDHLTELVQSHKLGKRTCVRGPLINSSSAHATPTVGKTMYGLCNYLPDQPDGEDAHSVEEHIKWMCSEWNTRPSRPDYPKMDLLMDKTLSHRRHLLIHDQSPVEALLTKFPWLHDEHEVTLSSLSAYIASIWRVMIFESCTILCQMKKRSERLRAGL